MNLKLLFGCWVIFETIAYTLCDCPYNCIVCLNAVIICNKWKEVQQLSGKYTIGTINAGAFKNAEIVTLLDVSHSSIHTIENGAFEGLDSIKTLDLSNNEITALQNNVSAPLSTLEDLDVSYNSIQTLESDALKGLTSLKTLDLSHNDISYLPDGCFDSLSNLETLDLSHNSIKVLNPNAFLGLGNLTKFYLDHNLLSMITSTGFLNYLPSLQEIKLSGNKWKCDCNITNIIHILDIVNVIEKSSIMCSEPTELKDSQISELDLYAEPLACFEPVPSPSPSPSPSLSLSPSPSSIQPSSSPSPLPLLVSPSPTITLTSSSTLLTSSTTTILPPLSFYSSSSSSSSSLPFPSPTSSSSSSLSSSVPVSSSSSSSSPTIMEPTPSCLSSTVESSVGITKWKDTQAGESSSSPCPYGPESGNVIRLCLITPDNMAVWGDVQGGGCYTATNYLQNLANGVTEENALSYSSNLLKLPFNHLTKTDISILVELSLSLFSVARDDIRVLINVFAAIDLSLEGSRGNPLSTESSKELQDLVNSALFKIVSTGNQEVVIDLANFFLGGKNIQNTDRVEAIIVLNGDDAGLQFVRNGTKIPARDIEVEYDKEGSTDVQVLQITVYTNNTLYTEGCVEGSDVCNGEVETPVTVVNTNDGNVGSVNVTFELRRNETGKCAVWNSTQNDGAGEWEFSSCKTIILSLDKVLCECKDVGAIALIKVPNITSTPPPITNMTDTSTPLAVQISFWLACGLSATFHLPVIVASLIVCCRYGFVRNIQALLNQALAQSLVFVILAVSYQNIEIYELCLGLGSLLHYLILVTFTWFLFRPIILLFSLIRRNLYERDCFILPFTFMAWALPFIPISIYGVLTFTSKNFENEILNNCWYESLSFPSYFPYLSAVAGALVTMCVIVILIIMATGGYTVTGSGYAQLIEIFVEMFLFCVAIGSYFLSASQQTDIFLLITAGTVLLCGIYFFTANVLARAKLRNGIICKKDNYFKGIPSYDQPIMPSTSNTLTSKDSTVRGRRGARSRHKSEVGMRMDYINDHLYQHNRYPFNMWEEMKDGRRVRKPMAKGLLSDREFTGQGTSEV